MTCAILLAAGRSQRMGCQKLLLPFAGKTVIGHIALRLFESPLDRVIVVAGEDAISVTEAVHQAMNDPGATGPLSSHLAVVKNPDPCGDMLSTVRCGLRALPGECQTVLVALGDQPSITSRLVAQLLGAFATAARGILVPVYNGKTGHPILFSARYCQEVFTRYDDVGLRGLLQAHPDDIFEFAVSDSAILCDMDYPEDYRRELARARETR